jgi:hypothetical protein
MARGVVTGVLLGALAAGFAPVAHASSAPALAGETVVTAEHTSKMRVVVPAQARFAIDVTKAVSFSGPGRFVGLFLRENRAEQPDEAAFLRLPSQAGSLVYGWGPAVTLPGCTSPVPDPLPKLYADCSNVKYPEYFTLHRGTYTLYVLTDGAPLTVRLHVANLGGSTTLAPSTRVASGETAFTTSVNSPVTWSGGAAVKPTGPADVFTVAWWRQDESQAADAGACWYDDSDGIEPLGEHRYVPGCPGGSSGGMAEVASPVYGAWGPAKGGRHVMLGTSGTPGAGTVGHGVWSTAQNVREAGGLAVWMAH